MRITKTYCAVLLLVSLSGCPAGPMFMLGLWLFGVDGAPGGFTGAAFLPNGEMDEFDVNSKPPGSNGVFTGTLTWQQAGNNLTVSQNQINGNGRIYAGVLENTTYMTGTWTNINDANDTGTFIASRAPLN